MQVISETDEEIVLEWDYTLETYNHIFAIKRTIDTKVAGVHIELCCENTKLSNVKPDTFHHQMSLLPIKFDPRLLEYTRPTHPSYQSRYPTEQELTEIGESGRPTSSCLVQVGCSLYVQRNNTKIGTRYCQW